MSVAMKSKMMFSTRSTIGQIQTSINPVTTQKISVRISAHVSRSIKEKNPYSDLVREREYAIRVDSTTAAQAKKPVCSG